MLECKVLKKHEMSTIVPIRKIKNTNKGEEFKPVNLLTVTEKILEDPSFRIH